MTKRIFISYRREDTAAAAGRVYDRLCRLMPASHVFIDVNAIRGGEKFDEAAMDMLENSIAGCDSCSTIVMLGAPLHMKRALLAGHR